jgi:hypothetical protein
MLPRFGGSAQFQNTKVHKVLHLVVSVAAPPKHCAECKSRHVLAPLIKQLACVQDAVFAGHLFFKRLNAAKHVCSEPRALVDSVVFGYIYITCYITSLAAAVQVNRRVNCCPLHGVHRVIRTANSAHAVFVSTR